MRKITVLIYGIIGFILFNLSLIYFIGFIANFPFFPTTLDAQQSGDLFTALLIDLLLIAMFGLQHSLMARLRFKNWWSKFIPDGLERSTYVLFASFVLILLCILWRPIPIVLWEVHNTIAVNILWGLFWAGWLFGIFSSNVIDFADLTGLRQTCAFFKNQPYAPPPFKIISIYCYIRHPIMLGTLIGLWSTPKMTVGHLLLATGLSIYIFIGIIYEEQDLLLNIGEEYRNYRKTTPALIPFFRLYL